MFIPNIQTHRLIETEHDGVHAETASSNSTLNNSSSASNGSSNLANKNGNGNGKFVRELSIDSHNTVDLNGFGPEFDLQSLSFSPVLQTQDVLIKCATKYKNLFDKTRINNKLVLRRPLANEIRDFHFYLIFFPDGSTRQSHYLSRMSKRMTLFNCDSNTMPSLTLT